MNTQKKICLHACCAPCVTVPFRRLSPLSQVDIFFYNPNIHPENEYESRKQEIVQLGQRWGFDVNIGDYDQNKWFSETRGFESEPERGRRCEICIRMRLQRTAEFAREGGYDAFACTLTVSPLKNAAMINRIGDDISEILNIPYIQSDFKKQDGFRESLAASREEKLYRQNYCGCIYSRPQ